MMRATLLLMACLSVASPAFAQEKTLRTIPFEGPEVFCHILHYEGLQPLASLKGLMIDPKQTILILFGNVRQSDVGRNVFDKLKPFESHGGNILIATDRAQAFNHRPIHITGTRVEQVDKDRAYRRDIRCPSIDVSEHADAPNHPIFRFLQKPLATNCPSHLEFTEPARTKNQLLTFQGNLNVRSPAGYIAGFSKNSAPVGRSLFIAGHGLFMNGMMLQSDNDNFNFALNVVRWLREGPQGQRTRAMFLVDGAIVTNFNVSLTPPPQMPMPPIKALDRLLNGLEKERFFQRIFDRLVGENRNALLGVLFAAVTFLLLVYGAKKLLEGRHLLEVEAPRMVGVETARGPATPVLVQRQNALLRQANLGTEARLLARAWLLQEFGFEPALGTADPGMDLQASGGFWTRRSLQRHADRVMQLASADVTAMTRRQFVGLLRTLPALSHARRAGQLALLTDGKTAGSGCGEPAMRSARNEIDR